MYRIHCRGPASAGLRVPEGWMAQAKNEGSDTKFDAGERPALVGLTELSEFNQALFIGICYITSKEQVHGMISQAEKVYIEIPRKCTGSSTDLFILNKSYFDQEGYQSDNYK